MGRRQTLVQLTDELVRGLDREAQARGLSRSALIRTLLAESLEDEREAEIGRQIVEGYTRIPQATPDEWGDLASLADETTRDVLRRLDAEERAAGHGPW